MMSRKNAVTRASVFKLKIHYCIALSLSYQSRISPCTLSHTDIDASLSQSNLTSVSPVDVPIQQIVETIIEAVDLSSMSGVLRGFVSAWLVDCKADELKDVVRWTTPAG